MSIDTIRVIQEFGFVLMPPVLAVLFYAYVYHLYKAERVGSKNYEKYGNIAVDDAITDIPVVSKDTEQNKVNKQEEQ